MKRERNAKQAFIEGTIRVVARDGLDKTTTKAIATEAGLSEAYIYRCFESKEALLCAAFHMEDVAFAYFLKQNLVGMHIQNTPWKDRAFQLWSASWRFILGRRDDCLFYLRYYYSANCRTYAYEEHLQCFQELFAAVEQTFKPEANVNMLLHQVFDTMLSFAARVLGGEMPDDDATTQWAFEQIYSFVVPNVHTQAIHCGRKHIPAIHFPQPGIKIPGSMNSFMRWGLILQLSQKKPLSRHSNWRRNGNPLTGRSSGVNHIHYPRKYHAVTAAALIAEKNKYPRRIGAVENMIHP